MVGHISVPTFVRLTGRTFGYLDRWGGYCSPQVPKVAKRRV